jgi:hypothetical protein
VVTTTIFHRAWEAWMPEEPQHRWFTPANFSFVEPRPVTQPRGETSGYLGLSLQELTPTLANQLNVKPDAGVLVAYVTPNCPADQAGLKSADVVLTFDGKDFSNSRELAQAVAKTKPGSKVPIELVRNGSNLTLEVIVERTPDIVQLAWHRRSALKIVSAGSQKGVLLPNGRLWLQHRRVRPFEQQPASNQGLAIWSEAGSQHAGFVEGSNWKDVAITHSACLGIQLDGTLWDLSETGFGGRSKLVGKDNDWESISAAGHFSALKHDGTLWQWGWRYTPSGPKWIVPTQVGSDTDWTAVCNYGTMSAAIKADGSVWRWDWQLKKLNQPQPWLTGACAEPVSFTTRGRAVAMVCADGTLWIGGEDLTNWVYTRFIGGGPSQRAAREMVKWRGDFDWKEIQFVGWGRAVGIKGDGTLWEWNVNRSYGPFMGWEIPPNLPSRYSDWISVSEDDNAFLALARDGSLCLWGDPERIRYDYWDGYQDAGNLLMPSRIKARRIADLSR